ncbi:lamin tail domain-containing protein [Fodinibius saliphilus]|uniref:lamin tail domain-containing protein n=1 Tax=Fodinibius saliphilus TaxID=1920650 RepID=UPI0011096A75|nr:lamin tail domain-containing protein [Fodinibius saliphilus]
MRHLLLPLILAPVLLVPTLAFSQTVTIDDDFSDGDHTTNPGWTDSESKYIVNGSNQLQLDAPSETSEAVISTSSSAAYGAWETLIELDFNPSGSNLSRFYIISDTQSMMGDVNGYFVEIGDTDDEISLYRQDGSTTTKIIDGTNDIIDTNPVTVRVKVTRNLNGNWELLVDTNGGMSYTSQGTVTDNTHNSSSYIGLFGDYTSTRSDKFFYDDVKVTKINPPLDITGATIIDNQTIDLQFNLDIDGATVSPSDFSLNNGINNPDGTTLPSTDLVRLTFNTVLVSSRYTLTVNDIDDTDGNTIAPNTTEKFILYGNYEDGDVKINEFTFDPPGSPSTIQEEYVELINTSSKILNLANWELGDDGGTDPFTTSPVVLEPDSFLVISGDTSALPSGRAYYELSGMAALNNNTDAIQLVTDTGTQADSLTYTSDWGGTDIALERLSTSTASTYQENWSNSPSSEDGTPGLPNEVQNDNTAPDLTSLNIATNQKLEVSFDERLNSSTATDPSNYNITGINISSATQTSANQVEIALASALQNNTEYVFSISGVEDIFNNTVINADTTFIHYEISPSDSGDVVINEFMSAPPSNSSEYIEVYNHSSKSLNLADWTLSDANNNQASITDSQFIVPPDSFVVIAPDNTLEAGYPNIAFVVMSSFPSLNNGGDTILIRNSSGTLLDSLTYNSDWGNDEVALERRSIAVAGAYKNNWGNAPNGFGTPGTANEIDPDTTPPILESLTVNSRSQLALMFSEQLDKTTAENVSNYSLNGGATISNVNYAPSDSVFLQLGSQLQNAVEYTLTIKNVDDLFSNPITSTDTSLTYYQISAADSSEVFVNEFNYEPTTGATEFIELYNPTSKSFDLQNWKLSDSRGNKSSISNSLFVIPPDSFAVIAPDNTILKDFPGINLVVMGNFPSLNNSGDAIVIHKNDGTLLDSLEYQSEWGSSEVSLERRSTSVSAIYAENWGDAPNGKGSPGSANEIAPDTSPPTLTSLTIKSGSQIALTFSEQLNMTTVENMSNYSLNGGPTISSVNYAPSDSVFLQLRSQLQNAAEYTLSIENINDFFANTIVTTDTTFTYYEISAADSENIYINEFNYEPASGTTEFIELYNPTLKSFDLQNWTLSDSRENKSPISNSPFVIPPDSFAVIAPDNTLLKDFPDINLVVMGDFPSLNNSGDDIVIHKTDGTLLDSLRYQSEWGGDEIPMERRTTAVSGFHKENWGDASNEKGTPGTPNTIAPDTDAPQLQDFVIQDSRTLVLQFTEQLKQPTVTNTGNFNLTNTPSVSAVQFTAPDSVFLTLDSSLQNATTYTLSASGITDIFDNAINSIDTTFTFYEVSAVDSGDVHITEFSALPNSGNTEFIELYNSTSKSFNLQNWTISDSRKAPATITTSQFVLPPDSFVVIAPDNTLLANNPNISLIPLGSGFPSLNNSDDQIILRGDNQLLLDSLQYNNSWNLSEGSMERRKSMIPAYYKENWEYSEATASSTTGQANTITQDNTAPKFKGLEILSNKTLKISFSERLTPATATDTDSYTLSGVVINSATAIGADAVELSLQSALQNAQEYTLSITGLEDIFGNALANEDSTFTYYELSPVTASDIFINEFSYNSASGETEYIEITNTSSHSFDLQGWTLNDNSGSPETVTDAPFVIPPDSFAVIAPDNTLRNNYPDIALLAMGNSFPSLNNSGDDIILRDDNGNTLDSLRYTSAWGGDKVALERRTTSVIGIYHENWGDAPTPPGSPGRTNTIAKDKSAPVLQKLSIEDASTIQLIFSEHLNSSSAATKSNYQISPAKDIQLVATRDDTVTLYLNSKMISGTTYTVTVSAVKDLFDNTLSPLTKQFEYLQTDDAQTGDIVVNEILYDPGNTGKADFIELYNTTDSNFDLEGWFLGDASRETSISSRLTIKSDEYMVLTGNQNFAVTSEKINYISGFPSLNNTTPDIIYLRTNDGITIDSLRYSQHWANPIDGTSLERKDPLAASNDASNWEASSTESGSSAGERNISFQSDDMPPEIIFSKTLSKNHFEVRFNEFIQLTDDLTFRVDSTPLEIHYFDSTQANVIVLTSAESKKKTTESTSITIQNLTDIKGNMTPNSELAVAHPLSPGNTDLVINEIMFDPLAKDDDNQPDQSEYIELRNTQDYAISLEGLVLHDAPDENGKVREIQPVTSTAKWVPSQGKVLIHADNTPQFEKSRVASFFDLENSHSQSIMRMDRSSLSLASSNDAIYIADSTGSTIDSVHYDESWQNPNLIDTKGIALERISPQGPSNNDSNWGSSVNKKGGTPNTENSIYQEKGQALTETGISFTPNPFTPDNNGNKDNLFINYKLDQPDYLIKAHIYDRYGRLVRELADGKQAGLQGQLIWDGRKDNGSRNRIGIYIVVFEAFDSTSGSDKAYKKTVVLARPLK